MNIVLFLMLNYFSKVHDNVQVNIRTCAVVQGLTPPCGGTDIIPEF